MMKVGTVSRGRGAATMSVSRSIATVAAVAAVFLILASACGDDAQNNLSSPVDDAGADTQGVDASVSDSSVSTDALVANDGAPVRADFGLDQRPKGSCVAPSRPSAPVPVVLQRVFPNLDLSLGGLSMMEMAPNGQRWFGTQLKGKIVSFPSTGSPTTADVVADIETVAGIPVSNQGESGLLGLAFHPKFQQNGRLYVSWNSADGPSGVQSRIGYLTSLDGGVSFTSYTNLLVFDQPGVFYHHGGGIAFGPDGLLYVSFGDGGTASRGAETSTFFSKVLRIDVDAVGKPYGIPPGNPFAQSDGGAGNPEPATYAYGFRNPFRLSVDRPTGDVWVGDVGAGAYEEIDRLRRSGGYYGWDCREGLHPNPFASDPASCTTAKRGELDPMIEIARDANPHAIVGGHVYRGAQIPSLVGAYAFGDYSSEVHVARFDPTNGAVSVGPNIDLSTEAVGAFAQDLDGELYVVHLTGTIYKIVAPAMDGGTAPVSLPSRLSETGCDPRSVASGLIPYDVNVQAWNNGAESARWFAVPDGTTVSIETTAASPEGHLTLPIGSVIVETLSRAPLGAKIETRLLVRHSDGDWAGYSYEWLDDQSDALLLPWSKKKSVPGMGGTGLWSFPSRAECVECHTAVGGRALGLELGQLNRDFTYASTNRISNQLRTFEHIGLLAAALPPLAGIVTLPDLRSTPSTASPVDARARAYLHTNCSSCHQPGAPVNVKGDLDLRFSRTLAQTKTCDVDALSGAFGITNAKLLAPGVPARSHLSFRPHATDARQMPPIGLEVVDQSGLSIVDDWITSLTTCP